MSSLKNIKSNLVKARRNNIFNEDWKDEGLLKFPKIEQQITATHKKHGEIQNQLLNQIKVREQRLIQEKIDKMDSKINIKSILQRDAVYKSLKNNKKPLSTFLDRSLVNRILFSVAKHKNNPNFNSQNFARKVSETCLLHTNRRCKRCKKQEEYFDNFELKKIYASINTSEINSTEHEVAVLIESAEPQLTPEEESNEKIESDTNDPESNETDSELPLVLQEEMTPATNEDTAVLTKSRLSPIYSDVGSVIDELENFDDMDLNSTDNRKNRVSSTIVSRPQEIDSDYYKNKS